MSSDPEISTEIQGFTALTMNETPEIPDASQSNKLYPNIDPPQPPTVQLKRIIEELIQTERFYMENLRIMGDAFMGVLEVVLSPDTFDQLKTYVELVKTHKSFMEEITRANDNDCVELVCEAMIKMRSENLHVYAKLAKNREMVLSLMENAAIKRKVDNALELKCNPDDLASWPAVLFEPRRRLVYYAMLFKRLVREVTECNTTKQLVVNCEKLTQISVDLMDNIYQQSANQSFARKLLNKVEDLQLPTGTELADYGLHLLEGRVTLMERKTIKTKCYAYLFQQMALFTIADKNGQMKHHRAAVLSGFNTFFVKHNRFVFTAKDASADHDFYFEVKSAAEAKVWCAAIREIIDIQEQMHIANSDQHRFALTTFDGLKTCGVCEHFVGGSNCFECSKCRAIVHQSCLNSVGRCRGENEVRPSLIYPVL